MNEQHVVSAAVIMNAVEIASGILRLVDGNDISSTQDGPRSTEQDVAAAINRRLSARLPNAAAVVREEINHAS